jgi:MFS family permease
MAMISAPLITILCRHFTPNLVMILGALFQGAGLIAASFASQMWHLYLSQGALVGVGVGCAYVPTVAILSQWFEGKRSLASGIAAAGSGVGGVLFSFTTQYGFTLSLSDRDNGK